MAGAANTLIGPPIAGGPTPNVEAQAAGLAEPMGARARSGSGDPPMVLAVVILGAIGTIVAANLLGFRAVVAVGRA